jgi:hypothetical protein
MAWTSDPKNITLFCFSGDLRRKKKEENQTETCVGWVCTQPAWGRGGLATWLTF